MVAAPIGRGVESGRGCECGLEAAHEQIERFIGVGGDLLGEGIDVRGVRIFAEEKEQAVAQHCCHAGMLHCSMQPCVRACTRACMQPCCHAARQPCSHAAMHAAVQRCSFAAMHAAM